MLYRSGICHARSEASHFGTVIRKCNQETEVGLQFEHTLFSTIPISSSPHDMLIKN